MLEEIPWALESCGGIIVMFVQEQISKLELKFCKFLALAIFSRMTVSIMHRSRS